MNLEILKNDFKKNRTGNTALLLFVMLAAGLVAAAAIIITQLFTSIIGMYETARPPHFLQMHSGEIGEGQEAIDTLNKNYEGLTAWQTVPMINVYGENIKIYGTDTFDLSNCILDISLVKQNVEYDLLLDKERNSPQLKEGEIGIPVILLDTYNIQVGDTVVVIQEGIERKFTVALFVYDAQMNSTMCSSTRILVSDVDFEAMFGKVGEIEYLIEAYFTDTAMAAGYQSTYEMAGLPQNGQAVTYTIIILLSALTDIMAAMVLMLVSFLLVLIALFCIKYTVMASLEEELGEIGVMKAIGMSYQDIRNMYLGKLNILIAVGIIMGYFLANIFSGIFTRHVSNTFGEQSASYIIIAVPAICCAVLYAITNFYCKGVLKKIKGLTVVDALVTGKGLGKKERVRDGLHRANGIAVNLLMGIREVFYNFNQFGIIFAVLCIVTSIVIIPSNLWNTMNDKQFITYMGSTVDDILIEIKPGEELEKKHEDMMKFLEQDKDVADYLKLRGVRVKVEDADGEETILHIDSGSHSGEGLQYVLGQEPLLNSDIALSALNADKIGRTVGDSITVTWNNMQMEFRISGIYQDVTSGGYTAKAVYDFVDAEAEKYSFCVDLNTEADIEAKVSEWKNIMGGSYTIESMEEFINQTLGGVSRQIKLVVIAVLIVGFIISSLIVFLFMKLKLARDVSQIAAMKAIGFTNRDVRLQYLYKVLFTAVLGVVSGTLLANFIGDNIASIAFAAMGFGITNISFMINPWIAFLLLPVSILIVSGIVAWIGSGQIRKYNIISLL